MTQKYCLTLSTQKAGKRCEIEDNWFHECREKKIPFITVRQKAGNSDIHHDYINLPVEFDGTFFDLRGNRLADEIISMYRRFYAQVPESKMSVTTSSCATWFRAGSESDPPILDLTKPLSRRERRELTNRLRKKKPAVRRKFVHGTDEQKVAIAKTIDEIHLTTGITISQGEALHLMAGGKSCFDGKWCRGTVQGEVFSAAPSHQTKSRKILNRVAGLANITR